MRVLIAFIAAGLLAPAVAAAQDAATEIRLVAHDTCGQNYGSRYELSINGTVVGSFAPRAGCTCGHSGTYTVATINDPAILAALEPAGCNDFTVRVTGGWILFRSVGVEVDRQQSGTTSTCVGGDCSFEGGICESGYQWLYRPSFSSSAADQDGDGVCDGLDPDRDGDGFANEADNCPAVSNPDQADSDGNGTGDLCQPVLATVPWLGDPRQPHQVYAGGTLVLQGAAYLPGTGEPVALASATWDPGDGSGPRAIAAGNSLALELSHVYNGSEGQPFTAVLEATDTQGNTYRDTFKVIIAPRTLDVEVNMAIDRGLWNLHKSMRRGESQGVTVGYWIDNNPVAATSSAVQAFEINGHRENGNVLEDPYVHDAARGLRYVLQNIGPVNIANQTYGNPDTNGNGIGIEVKTGPGHYRTYVGGQVIDALVASHTPGAVATTGHASAVRGRTYRDIVQDMLDMYAFGQSEGGVRGGWIYNWNDWGVDSSASQWAAIGDLAAQVWGVALPQFVRDENLNHAIPHWQYFDGSHGGIDGRCGYRDRSGNFHSGMAETPSCMIMMIMDGLSKTHARWVSAEKYMRRNWETFGLKGNLYAMFAFAKAMRLARDDQGRSAAITLLDGDLDWYRSEQPVGFARYLVNAQQADGHWSSTAWVSGSLSTAWAIIILSPTIFELGPIAHCTVDPLIDGTLELGGEAEFSGLGSTHQDPDGEIVSYHWDFRDGSTATGPEAVHSFADVGTYHVTLTVTDSEGLQDSTTCPVQVVDSGIPPNAETNGPFEFCIGSRMVLDGTNSRDLDGHIVSYEWDWTPPIDFAAIDGNGATVDVTAVFEAMGPGEYDVGLRVTDNDGRSSPEFTTVTVLPADDPSCNQPPVAVALPDGAVFECSSPAGTPVALNGSDSTDPDADPLSYAWSPVDGLDDATSAIPTGTFAVGSHTLTLTVTDPSGASDDDPASFEVVDTQGPEILCEDAVAECEGALTAVNIGATAHDVCEGDLAPAADHDGGFPLGDTVVTWTARDSHGNEGLCAAVVSVLDRTPPTASCTGDRQECAGALTPVTTACSGSDVCDATVDASSTAQAAYPLGTHAFTCTATDDSGNADSASCEVVVVDTTAPVLTCAEDAVVHADAQCVGHADPQASAADVCDAAPVVTRDPAGTEWSLGTHTVTHTAVDGSGNAASCTSTVEVVDVTPPAIQCNSRDIIPPDAPIEFQATATDNCSVASVAITGYDCWMINGAGKRVDKRESCSVAIDGDRITILDSGGVNDNIEWTVVAIDGSGNVTETTCAIHVNRPGGDGDGGGGGEGGGCNQGIGNGDEGCDPGNSNQGDPANSNDENAERPGKRGGR